MILGFSAGDSLVRPTGFSVTPPSWRAGTMYEVRAASCFGDCFSDCMADGMMSKPGCNVLCTQECGGKPPDNPPYVCKPMDNSINHNLCIGAHDVWQAGASAVCTATLGGVPVIGPALVAACVAGVNRVAKESKAQCPPATICV
jgi:hypothetical protein